MILKYKSYKLQAASFKLDKVTIYDYMGDMKRKIRSKHNDLMNYFIHDARDLSPAYLASCRKFFKELSPKPQAGNKAASERVIQAASNKPQAP